MLVLINMYLLKNGCLVGKRGKSFSWYEDLADSRLPLDPVLVAISELLPKIQDSQSQSASIGPSSKVLRLLKELELNEVLPPAPPIAPRRFQVSFQLFNDMIRANK